MDNITIKDYRASHLLLGFLRAQVQGWYTRENILAKASDPEADPGQMQAAVAWIERTRVWHGALKPGCEPPLTAAGRAGPGLPAGEVKTLLNKLFSQFAAMNDKLNAKLDDQRPLHERRHDVIYLLSCLGWAYYAVNHMVHGDIAFAKEFGDDELLRYRDGDAEASEKELGFVNTMFSYHKADAFYHPETSGKIAGMAARVLNENLRGWAQETDKYLTLLGA